MWGLVLQDVLTAPAKASSLQGRALRVSTSGFCRDGGSCQAGTPASDLGCAPSAAARPRSLPLSQRQLMLMQRPLLQVNCVKGKQVG